MKIKKHKVVGHRGSTIVFERLYGNKERAMQVVDSYKDSHFTAEYRWTVEIDLYCESCDKDLKPGGEQVADENDGEFYDEYDTETEVHEV